MRKVVALFMVFVLCIGIVSAMPVHKAEAKTAACETAAWAHYLNPGFNIACVWSVIYDMFGNGADADGLSG